MKKTAWKTTTFETGFEDFMIDIVEHIEHFPNRKTDPDEMVRDVWLYRAGYGIKDYVIGELQRYWEGKTVKETAEEMIDYIENDLNNDGKNWYEQYNGNYY